MTDVHDSKTRSYNMSQIKAKNSKPEMLVRRFLHNKGYRFRLHQKNLPGKPDIVLKKYNTVIFTNGCFWHGHEGCKYFKIPQTRTDWWVNKIEGNKRNDTEKYKILKGNGWNIIIIWECELKPSTIENTLPDLINNLVK